MQQRGEGHKEKLFGLCTNMFVADSEGLEMKCVQLYAQTKIKPNLKMQRL